MVSRLTLACEDVNASVRFHREALSLWLLAPAPASRAGATGAGAASVPALAVADSAIGASALLGGSDASGCQLEFVRGVAKVGAAGYCVAVSNLQGAAARVPRKGGKLIAANEALAPAGHNVRLVHAFRRAPLLHVVLHCSSPIKTAEWYSAVAGLQVVPAEAKAAAAAVGLPDGVPPGGVLLRAPSQPAAAALLLLQAPASSAAEDGSGGDECVLTIRLDGADSSDTADAAWAAAERARVRAEALGTAAGPVAAAPGAAAAFTCLDPDGHVLYLVHRGGGRAGDLSPS